MAKVELTEFAPEADWIDLNGHMNVAYYVVAFDRAIDQFLRRMGLGPEYGRERRKSVFTMQNYVNHVAEVLLGTELKISLQLIDLDAKRLHLFLEMRRSEEGDLVATDEQMLLHVDLDERRACRFPDDKLRLLEALMTEHKDLPRPEYLGRSIRIPSRQDG